MNKSDFWNFGIFVNFKIKFYYREGAGLPATNFKIKIKIDASDLQNRHISRYLFAFYNVDCIRLAGKSS